jgi:UDP-N-acetylglucosamine 2-epimerase (non-hydrolysing)
LNKKDQQIDMDISRRVLPIKIYSGLLSKTVNVAKKQNSPVLAIVIGTKPDFYKQAPIVFEAAKQGLPVIVIDTGQHFDDLLGFGIKEFELQSFVACNLQI